MHYHMEIIMPPTTDVKAAITEILKPFDENGDDECSKHTFWDWWQIGGRFSGSKRQRRVPKEKIDAFQAELQRRKVTVSGLVCGKETLSPAEQIPMVDALWREMCPGAGDVCPLFSHSGQSQAEEDICKVSEIPDDLTASAVIVATPSFHDGDWTGPPKAQYMIHAEVWNGVTWARTMWDGKVKSALTEHVAKLKGCKAEYIEKATPRDDWLVVTVDYHS